MIERAYAIPIRDNGSRLAPIEVGKAGTPQTVRIPIAATLRAVLTAGCSSFVLVHTHPHGDLTPSALDKALVRRFLRAAEYLGMTLVDSVIESPRGTLSMVAAGLLTPLPADHRQCILCENGTGHALTAASPQTYTTNQEEIA